MSSVDLARSTLKILEFEIPGVIGQRYVWTMLQNNVRGSLRVIPIQFKPFSFTSPRTYTLNLSAFSTNDVYQLTAPYSSV